MHSYSSGKLTLLDIGNNEISSRGAFHVAEYIKKAKSLLWLNLYMNDIGDEVLTFFSHFNNTVYAVINYIKFYVSAFNNFSRVF